jgi:hypothetical protein
MFTLGMENLMLARINLNQKRHGHQRQLTYFRGRAYQSQRTKISEVSFSPKVTAEDVNVSKLKYCIAPFKPYNF